MFVIHDTRRLAFISAEQSVSRKVSSDVCTHVTAAARHRSARHAAVSAARCPQLSVSPVPNKPIQMACATRRRFARSVFATPTTSGATALPTSGQLQTVLDGLDDLNSKDPRTVEVGQQAQDTHDLCAKSSCAWLEGLSWCTGGLRDLTSCEPPAGPHFKRSNSPQDQLKIPRRVSLRSRWTASRCRTSWPTRAG
jgi:hypothetical protein